MAAVLVERSIHNIIISDKNLPNKKFHRHFITAIWKSQNLERSHIYLICRRSSNQKADTFHFVPKKEVIQYSVPDRFRANQIAVITSDFKMDVTNFGIKFIITSLVGKKK